MSDPQVKSIIEPRIEGLAEIGRGRFDYEPLTGVLRFADPGPAAFSTLKGYRIFKAKCLGKIAGSPHSSGYLSLSILGRSLLVHRLIWAIVTGKDPGVTIDHRDGDRRNNRWANLREATRSQNAMNRRMRSDCASGVRGVHWHRAAQAWVAQVCIDGESRHLGCFAGIGDAKAAYEAAAATLHGDFAAHRGALATPPLSHCQSPDRCGSYGSKHCDACIDAAGLTEARAYA